MIKLNTTIDDVRKDLLRELNETEDSKFTEEFRKKFLRFIEEINFDLMNGEDNFFALFLIQIKRDIREDIASACETKASLSYFTMYFNPHIFLNCSISEMKALIKHEIYHIMYNHIKRAEKLSKKYSSLAINTGMDVSINQYINSLPPWSLNIENVKLEYNITELKYDKPLEYYVKVIQENINKKKKDKINGVKGGSKIYKNFDEMNIHKTWSESYNRGYENQIDELKNKIIRNSAKGRIPKRVQEYLDDMNKKAEISWQMYLKKAIGTLPKGYKKTITRKDRRQPYRMDLRGKLSDHIIKIVVAIDISGSMTDGEIDAAMTEIFDILKNKNYELTIIECDNIVRRMYRVNKPRDMKKKLDTKGGTSFSPVFEYLHKNRMEDCFLIYFTDGMGEQELVFRPKVKKLMWVLTGAKGDLSLVKKCGEVKKLKNEVVETLEPYKDILFNRGEWVNNEWAK
ncbi:peptidase [Clostridium acetobutylicum]|nr:peptidase [Clostridium acetobutylicum]